MQEANWGPARLFSVKTCLSIPNRKLHKYLRPNIGTMVLSRLTSAGKISNEDSLIQPTNATLWTLGLRFDYSEWFAYQDFDLRSYWRAFSQKKQYGCTRLFSQSQERCISFVLSCGFRESDQTEICSVRFWDSALVKKMHYLPFQKSSKMKVSRGTSSVKLAHWVDLGRNYLST